jgi:chemotaxis regulatin CheY-phosphate phosphatase CheZ
MASKMNTSQKVSTCLDYIDRRLETTSEQTIQIAEMIINDIKELTAAYPEALKNNQLREHAERVRTTQMKWVNQLHDIILEQTNRDLNGQVIQALQNFINTMNKKQLKHLDFDMPSAVKREQPEHEHEYLTQEQIEALMASDIKQLPVSSTHH